MYVTCNIFYKYTFLLYIMKRIKFFRIILAQKYFNLIEVQYFYREYNC